MLSWKWKEEPVSPAGYPDFDSDIDTWGLFEDEEVQQQKKSLPITTHKQEKKTEPTRAEIASKLLKDLDDIIKEEPFADWLEEKVDLPLFDDLPPGLDHRVYGQAVELAKPLPTPTLVMTVPSVIQPQMQQQMVVPQDTQTLLREFENVYGEIEQTHGTLTPPQSPPLPTYNNVIPENPKEELITLQQMVPIQPIIHTLPIMKVAPLTPLAPIIYATERKETLLPLEQMVPETPSPDVVRELQAVEELVRTRAEDLVDISNSPCTSPWDSYSGCASGASSGGESEGESYMVAPPSPCTSSSGSSYGSGEEMCDDPEWIPTSVQVPAPGCLKGSRKRSSGSKPYSRPGVEEKRMRKKEQNKNAATRYRQKKKAEIEEILSEEKGLEDKNSELQVKVSDLSREIKYLKGLMRDLFKAKGLIK